MRFSTTKFFNFFFLVVEPTPSPTSIPTKTPTPNPIPADYGCVEKDTFCQEPIVHRSICDGTATDCYEKAMLLCNPDPDCTGIAIHVDEYPFWTLSQKGVQLCIGGKGNQANTADWETRMKGSVCRNHFIANLKLFSKLQVTNKSIDRIS